MQILRVRESCKLENNLIRFYLPAIMRRLFLAMFFVRYFKRLPLNRAAREFELFCPLPGPLFARKKIKQNSR